MSASKGNRSTLPPLADLAAELRDGHDLGDVAVAVGISADQLRYRLNAGGWDSHGQPTAEPSRGPVVPWLQGDVAWMEAGLCAQTDPEAFFPEKGGSTREAKAMCAVCPVAAECLDYALANQERFGIWGGLSERDRRKVAKAMTSSETDTHKEAS